MHPYIHTCTYTHAFIGVPDHALIHPSMHSSIHPPMDPSNRPSTYRSICLDYFLPAIPCLFSVVRDFLLLPLALELVSKQSQPDILYLLSRPLFSYPLLRLLPLASSSSPATTHCLLWSCMLHFLAHLSSLVNVFCVFFLLIGLSSPASPSPSHFHLSSSPEWHSSSSFALLVSSDTTLPLSTSSIPPLFSLLRSSHIFLSFTIPPPALPLPPPILLLLYSFFSRYLPSLHYLLYFIFF